MKKVKDVDIVFEGDLSEMENHWKSTKPVYLGRFSYNDLMSGEWLKKLPRHKTDNQPRPI